MSTKNYISVFAASFVFITAGLAGCGGEYDGGEDAELAAEAAGDDVQEEAIGEAEQAFSDCTQPGSGGGNWDVLALCATWDKQVYVQKYDWSKFTSTGQMSLKHLSSGITWPKYVGPDTWSVGFGQKPSGCYKATFYSNAPGISYTGTLCI